MFLEKQRLYDSFFIDVIRFFYYLAVIGLKPPSEQFLEDALQHTKSRELF